MRIVEIEALSNGAHRNQSGSNTIPQGWAVIPGDMALENFPFGEVTAEEINGVMTVTKWVAGIMPEPQFIPEPEGEVTTEDMARSITEGVNEV